MNTDNKIAEKINYLLAEKADFWSISDLQINYLKESIQIHLLGVKKQEIVKTFIDSLRKNITYNPDDILEEKQIEQCYRAAALVFHSYFV